ncbi:MAG: MarC family protein [Bacteroides sp.]|nr:MarC family protein [Bacteroides sp.]
MEHILTFGLLCIASFFTLTNPFSIMPAFLSMTQGMSDEERIPIVRRATITAFITLLVFTLSGQVIFWFFGISTDAFRIVGGMIIMKVGFDMLNSKVASAKSNDNIPKKHVDDISITPLGIPMLCGPAVIAAAIVKMEDAETYAMKAVLIISIAIIYLIAFYVLKASTRVTKFLGETGNNVMIKLMGLILLVIAVECIVSGAKPILADIIKEGMTRYNLSLIAL